MMLREAHACDDAATGLGTTKCLLLDRGGSDVRHGRHTTSTAAAPSDPNHHQRAREATSTAPPIEPPPLPDGDTLSHPVGGRRVPHVSFSLAVGSPQQDKSDGAMRRTGQHHLPSLPQRRNWPDGSADGEVREGGAGVLSSGRTERAASSAAWRDACAPASGPSWAVLLSAVSTCWTTLLTRSTRESA